MKQDAPSPEKTPKQAPSSDAVVTPPPAPEKKSKKWLVAGISAATVLVIGAGAAGAAYLMQQNSPNRIIADSILNNMAMPNQKNAAKLSFKAKDVDVELTIDAVSRDAVQSGSAKVSLKMPNQPVLELTARMYQKDHNTAYLKLENPEKIKMLLQDEAELYGPIIDTVTKALGDKWLRLEAENSSTNTDCTQHVAQKLRQHNTNEAKAVRKALRDHQFITHDESVKLEDKGSSRGYQVNFDRQVFGQFVEALEKDENAKEVSNCVKELKKDFASVIQQFKAAQVNEAGKGKTEITDMKGQLWIDTATRRITDAKMQATVKGKNTKGQEQKADVAVETKAEYGDFDTAAEPAKDATISLEELMQVAMEGVFNQGDAPEDEAEL